MKYIKYKEQGVAAIVIVFVLFFLIAGMVVTISMLAASSISDSSRVSDYSRALYLAETALEKSRYILNQNISCSDPSFVDATEINFGGGSFQIVSSNINTPAIGNCEVLTKGNINNIVVYIKSVIDNFGGTGGGGGAAGSFVEHFPDLVGWSWVPSANQGTVSLDVDCGPCVDSSGFSLKAATNAAGSWRSLTGYAEKILVDPIDSTAGPTVLDWSMAFKKNIVGTLNPSRQRVELALWDSSNGFEEQIWKDWATDNSNVWTVVSGNGVALTNGHLFDRIRVYFDMRGRVDRVPEIWVDEIELSAAGVIGLAPDWRILTWSEVNQ